MKITNPPRHQLPATSSRRIRAARRRNAAGAFHLYTSYFPHLALSSFILLTFSFLLHAAQLKEALLIANGKYSHFAGLAHPSPDAAKLSAALEQLGFRVRVVRDGNREEMLDAISEFERGLRNTGAIAFFHYGGHGVQVDGKNYLLPADADIPDERRVATRAVALDEVMTAMDAAAARASIIVIDACRDNPLPAGSGRNLARGLSVVGMKPKNSIVIYAAEAGSKALDGLFTPILAVALQQKGRTIDQVMKSVRSEVYAKSSGQQTPGEYNQLFEELFLGEPAGDDLAPEKIFAAKPAPTPYATPTPAPLAKDDMVLVEGGTLPDASDLAGKSVKSFYIGRTEVTWLEWKKVKNWAADNGYDIGNVGAGSGNDHPVRDVSWYDCLKWCNARSEMEGLSPVYLYKGGVLKTGGWQVLGSDASDNITFDTQKNGYRLPTIKEWEWAARGGISSMGYTYSGSNDINAVAWYSANAGGATHPVGTKLPNEIGIFDMTGNTMEWCWDRVGIARYARGGTWNNSVGQWLAVNQVGNWLPSVGNFWDNLGDFGFRLARNIMVLGESVGGNDSPGGILASTPTPYATPTPAPLAKDDMVLVEGGTLPDASELAGKSVKSFYIGRTEVTWLEWKKVRNWAADNGYDIGNVGEGSGNDHPVQNVNWYDCVKWCNARSEMAGLTPVYQAEGKVYRSGEYGKEGSGAVTQSGSANGYRLPSEAEWEWAARGGEESRGYKYSGSDDLNAVAWWRGNSKGAAVDLGSVVLEKIILNYWSAEQKQALVGLGTWPVGQKGRNELDLHDMTGNVWEWCWDLNGTGRRLRGGCWLNPAGDCAVSFRFNGGAPDIRNPYEGLRLARSL